MACSVWTSFKTQSNPVSATERFVGVHTQPAAADPWSMQTPNRIRAGLSALMSQQSRVFDEFVDFHACMCLLGMPDELVVWARCQLLIFVPFHCAQLVSTGLAYRLCAAFRAV